MALTGQHIPRAANTARAAGPAALARLPRVLRFALTGAAAALVQLALLRLLIWEGAWPLPANLAAFATAAQVNFALSLLFTWADRGPGRGIAARWLRFTSGIAGTGALNLAVFAAASTAMPPVTAAALGIGIAATVNFAWGNWFVFNDTTAESARAGVAP